MHLRLSSTTSFRLPKASSLKRMDFSKRRSSSLGPVKPKPQESDSPFRLVLDIHYRSTPLLENLRQHLRSWPYETRSVKRLESNAVLLRHLPLEYISLYPTIISEICKSHGNFEMGNGLLFKYDYHARIGIKLEPPREAIDICNEMLCRLPKGNIDMRGTYMPKLLHVPLLLGRSPAATERLLTSLEKSYPHGIPLGPARGLYLFGSTKPGKFTPQTVLFTGPS
jgi:hypothetical protein